MWVLSVVMDDSSNLRHGRQCGGEFMLNQLIQKSIENENQAPKALNIPYFLRFSIEMLRKYNE